MVVGGAIYRKLRMTFLLLLGRKINTIDDGGMDLQCVKHQSSGMFPREEVEVGRGVEEQLES